MTSLDYEISDIQAAKREVIKLGHDRGYLKESEITAGLPIQYMLPDEIETFLFTLEMMNIEVRLEGGGLYKNAARLTLVGSS